jgi:hypothetical protein
MKEIWGEIVGVRIIVITSNQNSNYKHTSRSIVEKRTTAERLVDRSDTAAQRRYSGLAYRQLPCGHIFILLTLLLISILDIPY